ncbi:hypothetical protein [Kribbella yunnanensis]
MGSRNKARLLVALSAIAVSVSGTMTATAAPLNDRAGSEVARFATQARDAGLSTTQARQLQRTIDTRLAQMQIGAHQVGFNEIMTDDGSAKVTLSVPGAKAPGDRRCNGGRLCLWAGDFYDHDKVTLYYCKFTDLGKLKPAWNDRLTSYLNFQTKGTKAKFYNYKSGKFQLRFTSTAPHREPDLGRYPGLNNMIDGVKPC